jgi:hypothetical protein
MACMGEETDTGLRHLRDSQNELDTIHLLAAYHEVKEQLRRLLLPKPEEMSSDGGGPQVAPHMFDNVMRADARHLAALVLSIIKDDTQRKDLVSKHDSDESGGLDQKLVDLLYAVSIDCGGSQ